MTQELACQAKHRLATLGADNSQPIEDSEVVTEEELAHAKEWVSDLTSAEARWSTLETQY